jgi:hypothetical protein
MNWVLALEEWPESLHHRLMLLNTAAGQAVSAPLAELLQRDLEERMATAEKAGSHHESLQEVMVDRLEAVRPLPPAPPCSLSCLIWIQRELLAVLQEVSYPPPGP